MNETNISNIKLSIITTAVLSPTPRVVSALSAASVLVTRPYHGPGSRLELTAGPALI